MDGIGTRSGREVEWNVWLLETTSVAFGICHGCVACGRALPTLDQLLVYASGLFDPEYYLGERCRTPAGQRQALNHFLKRGGVEGRAPSGLFDSATYLRAYPDVRDARINPLVHFIKHGVLEDRLTGVGFAPSKRSLGRLPWEPAFWHRLPFVGPDASAAIKELSVLIGKTKTKLLVHLPKFEELEIDLYVARSDFQRALLHNERLMRDFATLRECVSAAEAEGMTAEMERLVAEAEVLREDAREADRELVRWRARAEAAERQLAAGSVNDRV